MAKSMYFNRSYLSTKFKKETGMIILDCIMKEKIEEAKRLLRYTDKSATAIASYFGFFSQSLFSMRFINIQIVRLLNIDRNTIDKR